MKFLAFILSLLLAILTVAFIVGLMTIGLWLVKNHLLETAAGITILGFTVGFYGDMTDYVSNNFRRFRK